jgi:hypothetical protein
METQVEMYDEGIQYRAVIAVSELWLWHLLNLKTKPKFAVEVNLI